MELKKLRHPALKIPEEIAYILGLFVITRLALTAIGYAAHAVLWGRTFSGLEAFTKIWTVWDGAWYVNLARDGYSALPVNDADMANYAFFPLYPALVRLASYVLVDYALAGIVVSNVCLLVACYYIYRYVSLDADEATAKRSVKYLILFPAAFVFSAVLTESLFVALVVACLYYARKGNWVAAGILGFFVPLARLPGLAIVVPLAYEYTRQRVPSLAAYKDHALQRLAKPEAMALLFPFAGLGLFAAGNYYLTGDFLGFIKIQATWGGRMVLPPMELLTRLNPDNGAVFTGALFTVAALALMFLYFRKVDFGAWTLGLILILIPLFSAQSCYSMLRYLAVVFPLFIITAKITKDRRVDTALTIALAVVEGIFMALWTTWSPLIV
ncbi:MAG: hypothetical protein A4E28_00328 [Methanocella sp. PtaU1.Bin125]|nr:MAG: hypothetical protein A4E28_00328 [Methanocella sp. PtaU1.Bin125]